MNLLLDTNALIWSLTNSPRLTAPARAAIQTPANSVFVSAVSAWEMAIKIAQGKLHAPRDVSSWLPGQLERRRFTPLPIQLQHAAAVEHLPAHHKDPFDRLLIAQANVEKLTLVTADSKFNQYDVSVLPC